MTSLRHIVTFFLFLLFFSPFNQNPALGGGSSSAHTTIDYNLIVGKWQRTDGNYVLAVNEVSSNGQAEVEYFNPKPIHVAQTAVSTEQGIVRLFVRFQGGSYEGSTYALVYYAKKDLLVGYYYQAPTDKSYEVMFYRKN